ASLETLAARSRSAPSACACRCGLDVDDSRESTFAAARVISSRISRPGASRNYARANPKHSWGRPSGCASSARYAWSGFFSTEPLCLTGNEGKTRWRRKADYCCDAHLQASTSSDARLSRRKADVSHLRGYSPADPRVRGTVEKKRGRGVGKGRGGRGGEHREKNVSSQVSGETLGEGEKESGAEPGFKEPGGK